MSYLSRIKPDIFKIILDYISMRQLVHLDWDNIGLNPCPSEGLNQIVDSLPDVQIYYKIVKSSNPDEDYLEKSAKLKSRKCVKHFMGDGSWMIPDWGLYYAAWLDDMELIEFFISKGARSMNFGLIGATRGGNPNLAEFFRQKLKNNNNN